MCVFILNQGLKDHSTNSSEDDGDDEETIKEIAANQIRLRKAEKARDIERRTEGKSSSCNALRNEGYYILLLL